MILEGKTLFAVAMDVTSAEDTSRLAEPPCGHEADESSKFGVLVLDELTAVKCAKRVVNVP